MNALMTPAPRSYPRELLAAATSGWNRFWFSPADPATLGMIRILAGLMLLYTHAVWTLGLFDFFGPDAWVSRAAAGAFHSDVARLGSTDAAEPISFAWSFFWLARTPAAVVAVHVATLAACLLLTVGLFTRVAAIAATALAISYVNRVPGALFGLDQINVMLAMYLAVGPSGDAWSLDRWLAARKQGGPLPVRSSVGANLAIRLIQVHMSVIYFFAGISKLQGVGWWDGSALWGAFANLEYQTIDMTFMAEYPRLVALCTHATVFWEIFFCVLVWPRLLRPLWLFVAIPLHLGIGLCMGMPTFGLVMLIGCSSFVSPQVVRGVLAWCTRRAKVAEAAPSRSAARVTRQRVLA